MATSRDTTKILSLILAVRRMVREEFRHGIKEAPQCSFMQFEVLFYLKKNQMPFVRELARHFHITPPAATFIIEGMVRSGSIRRSFDRKDRRAVHLTLTRKGEALLRREMKIREKIFQKVFSVLSAEEKKMLARMLGKVVQKQRR